MTHERPTLGYEAPAGSPSRNLRLYLSAAALAITVLGWLWFVICVSATYEAWWNSLWVFVVTFGLAFAAGTASLFTRGSSVAIGTAVAGSVWAGASLAFALLLAMT